jgi:glutaminyl-tRNA synthetase
LPGVTAERNDFIRDIIDDDLRAGRYQRVATRFPPEPNGHLHIGHAKSICLNFGLARDYGGTCNLRYDDTNPTTEKVDYVVAIERDVRWLGFEPTAVLFSADYFPRMYELAERLVREGKAYVCDLTDDQNREYRGTLSEPGRPSPFRERSVDENLDLLRRMKAGEFPDGARTLRAKIDMASANMKMRDPLLYRIRHAHHHRTGDAWCIYPMYDFAHPLEDGIEGITHSICTLEFENNRELYDWVLDNTGPWDPRPHQYEFARLVLDYTVMSKRKLLTLVTGNHVHDWDDPRMPTIAGMRRRGYSAEAIRAFADMIGVAKANSAVDIGKLEYCVRDELNRNAPRVMGVVRPIEVELVGLPGGEAIDAPYYPSDVGKPGSRPLAIGNRIFIERDDWRDDPPKDYQRLAPGRTVRLRYAYCITSPEVVERDASGAVTKLRAKVLPETLHGKNPEGGGKVAGVIHWVDAATSVPADLRLYGRLFAIPKPEEGGADFLTHLDPESLELVTNARLEASLASAEIGSRWQLERVGYFIIDEDSKPGAIVANRIVTLRDSYAEKKPEAKADDGEKRENARAKSRPKSKSPAEYRAETRARDAELAAQYDQIAATTGVTTEQADLLTADRVTAALFRKTAVRYPQHAAIAAKWIVNELPRALEGRELADIGFDLNHFAEQFAELIDAIDRFLPGPAAKAALVEMVKTGKRFDEIQIAEAAGPTPSPTDVDDIVAQVIGANPAKVAEYRAGKKGLIGFFVGQAVKVAPNIDPKSLREVLQERLG